MLTKQQMAKMRKQINGLLQRPDVQQWLKEMASK